MQIFLKMVKKNGGISKKHVYLRRETNLKMEIMKIIRRYNFAKAQNPLAGEIQKSDIEGNSETVRRNETKYQIK
jgi:hypothetical protein